MVGVTDFFRDPEAWKTIAEQVVPDLFQRQSAGEPVRAWVLACSTGEEAFSLAICLEEHASTLEEPPEVTIFATDIDERALSVAREGRYPTGIADRVGPARLSRFFSREGDHYQASRGIRERIVFAPHNALQDPPFSRQSIITCRNLLVYLEPSAQERVIRLLAYALDPGGILFLGSGGILFLGSAENLTSHSELFEVVDSEHRIFRRNEVAGPPPAPRVPDGPAVRRFPAGTPPPERHRVRGEKRDARRVTERVLLDRFGPAAVLINARCEVLHFFGPTRRYLEASRAHGGTQVTEMALPGLGRALRVAIEEVQ